MADAPAPSGGKDIKLPGLGEVPKKYAIGGLLAALAVVVVVIIRKKGAANAAGATATGANAAGVSGQVTDPAGNVCSALDPNSGYCPGSPQDIAYQQGNASEADLALGDESDYGGTGGSAVSGDYDAAGYPIGSAADLAWQAAQEGLTTTGTSTTSGITTNSSWLTEAVDTLSAQGGDTGTIQTALSMVLGGLTVTTAQQDLFLEAVGILGPPPQGYPQPIKLSNTAATSTGTTSGTGSSGSSAKPPGEVTGLHSTTHTATTTSLAWGKPSGTVTSYQISYGPNSSGAKPHTTTAPGNQNGITIGNLPQKTRYYYTVRALNGSAGGPWCSSVGVTTS
jgi:fibronectin type III domain protein